MDRMPAGYKLIHIDAYTNGKEIVVCDQKGIDTPDEDRAEQHNCDALGCATFSHVICRGAASVDGWGLEGGPNERD